MVASTSVPHTRAALAHLSEHVRCRGRVGLREAMRLRALAVPPFAGATLFVMQDELTVEAAGGIDAPDSVCVASLLQELQRRLEEV